MSATESAAVPDNHFPMTIVQSRVKAAADLIWVLIIGALAVSGYESNVSHPQAWSTVLVPLDLLAIAVCGLLAIGCLVEIARPPRLILDSHGITERSLFRAHRIPWDEVENFRSIRVMPFWPAKMIKFDYVRPRAVHPILRAILRPAKVGTTLGPGWAMTAERLAALLNAARHHWVGSPQSG